LIYFKFTGPFLIWRDRSEEVNFPCPLAQSAVKLGESLEIHHELVCDLLFFQVLVCSRARVSNQKKVTISIKSNLDVFANDHLIQEIISP
jgi:hypothetical protein